LSAIVIVYSRWLQCFGGVTLGYCSSRSYDQHFFGNELKHYHR